MLNKDLIEKSVGELASLIHNQSISPVELTNAVFNQAESAQKKINSYMTFYKQEALNSAKKAEIEIKNGNYRGMYHGIPMAIKDNIYFKDKITTMSSKIHKDFVPDFDATVIIKLKKAGAIFTGKLNMHEYAWGATNNNPHYGAVRNPWNLSKISGGSSGGSGAAVATNASIGSLGTDTMGSIRIPSSACGIVGLKPTYGRVSTYGVFPQSWSLDHVGPMSKNVTDAAGLLQIISGFDSKDPTSVNRPVNQYKEQITGDVTNLIIGVNEDYFFNQVDSGIEKLVREGIQKLVDQGAKVQEVSIPSLEYAEWSGLITSLSETSAVHHSNILTRPSDFGDDVRMMLELGELPSAVDYLQAQQVRRQLKQDFQKVFNHIDVLITPTLPILPPDIGDDSAVINGEKVDLMDNVIRFTGPGNLTGVPTLSIPIGLDQGLPVGMQIIGAPFQEGKILNVGYAIEQTHPMRGRKPKVIY